MERTIRQGRDNIDLAYRASQVLFVGSLVAVASIILPEARELVKDGVEFVRETYGESYQRVMGLYKGF